jgi:hypothetical protein
VRDLALPSGDQVIPDCAANNLIFGAFGECALLSASLPEEIKLRAGMRVPEVLLHTDFYLEKSNSLYGISR